MDDKLILFTIFIVINISTYITGYFNGKSSGHFKGKMDGFEEASQHFLEMAKKDYEKTNNKTS